jgi:hypothetical protein
MVRLGHRRYGGAHGALRYQAVSPRFTDADKMHALRELETAHFEHGLARDGPRAEEALRRALEASNRMRELLGLPPVKVPHARH